MVAIPHHDQPVRLVRSVEGAEGIQADWAWSGWRDLELPWAESGTEAVRSWLAGGYRTLWVWSQTPGTGKTGFALSAARLMAERKPLKGSPLVVRIPEIATMSFADVQSAVASVKGRSAVVLDDVHQYSFGHEWKRQLWHEMMDTLYRDMTPVILTSNAPMSAVAGMAGPPSAPAFDRLREGGIKELEATGASARG